MKCNETEIKIFTVEKYGNYAFLDCLCGEKN